MERREGLEGTDLIGEIEKAQDAKEIAAVLNQAGYETTEEELLSMDLPEGELSEKELEGAVGGINWPVTQPPTTYLWWIIWRKLKEQKGSGSFGGGGGHRF